MQGAPSLPPSGLRKRGASSIFEWRAQGPDPEHLSPQNPQKSHSSPSCSWAIRAAGPRTCSDTAPSYGARPGHSTGSGSVLFGRLKSLLEGSVYFGGLLLALPGLPQDLGQGEEDGNGHGQEERDVDGKLLVVGEVEEVEERGVEEGSLRGGDGFLAGLESGAQAALSQLCHGILHRGHCVVYLCGNSTDSQTLATEDQDTMLETTDKYLRTSGSPQAWQHPTLWHRDSDSCPSLLLGVSQPYLRGDVVLDNDVADLIQQLGQRGQGGGDGGDVLHRVGPEQAVQLPVSQPLVPWALYLELGGQLLPRYPKE